VTGPKGQRSSVKITGVLISKPIDEIKQFMQDFKKFEMLVAKIWRHIRKTKKIAKKKNAAKLMFSTEQ